MNTRNLLSISLALSLIGISREQTVDPDFEPADSVGIPYNVTPLSNGGYLVNGYILGVSNKVVTRLFADGTADQSFDSALVSYDNVPEFQSHSLAMLANGNILVYGTGSSASIRNLVMLKPDGSLDSNFGQMLTDRYVACYAVQSDGKVLVGGRFTTIGGQARNRIARLNSDGTLDADFNTGTISNALNNPRVLSIAPLSNGKILIGGVFESVQGQSRNAVAMLNADGSLDADFNLSMNGNARAIALQPDGEILIGGNFTSILGQPRNRIARLNVDGSLDSGFDPNANAIVESMVLQADGKIIVTGGFTSIGGQPRNRIARLNADGTLANAFNAFDPDPNATTYSVALQQDGKMLVGGFFSNIGGQPSSSLVRLFNDPAVSTLSVTALNEINWTLGGSAPEFQQVTFELWNGSGWVDLGIGIRVAGGWQITGLSMPPSAWVRARGRVNWGRYNGSSVLMDKVISYGSGVLPDIALKDGALNDLTTQEGRTTIHSANIGTPGSQTFTIRNTGAAALENLAASVNGRDAARFSLGTLGATSLPPGGETTVTVTFTPDSANAARAFLEITSNDLDETPFVVNLGGVLAPEIAVEQPPGTDLGSGGGANFGVVTLGSPLARTFTLRNTGAVALDLGTITVTGTQASDFALDLTGTAASVASGGQTTLQFTFTPSEGGARNAVLTIPNNDPDENPFVLNLSGTGNTPPVFSGYSVSTAWQTAVTVSRSKLLANSSDADGHALSVTAAGPASAQGGTAVLGSGILYTPPAGFSGTDTFPVTLTDALGATVNGTFTVTVGAAPGSGGGSTLNPPQVTVQPNGKPKITFQGIPGRSYRVERTTNFSTWTTLANVTASPTGQVEYTDENPPGGSAFYRIARP